MWKKPEQRTPRSKGKSIGCMHGLFSMFYVSPGTPRKLLSDGPRRSKWYFIKKKKKPKLLKNVDEKHGRLNRDSLSEAGKAKSGAASVHSIKEEGISKQNSEIQRSAVPDLRLDPHSAKNENRRCKDSGVGTQSTNIISVSTSLESHKCHPLQQDAGFSNDINVKALMEGSNNRIHQDQQMSEQSTTATQMFGEISQNGVQLCEDDPVLQKTIDEVLENLLLDKFPDPNQTETSQQQMVQDMLKSNKELLLKALQDPKIINLLLVKHVESLQQSTITENQHTLRTDLFENEHESSIQKQRTQEGSFEDRSMWSKPPKGTDGSQRPSRIVILKPNVMKNQNSSDASEPISPSYSSCSSNTNKENEKGSFRLIAQEIRRRLRLAFGASKKHQQLLTMDDFSYRETSESQASDDVDGISDSLKEDDFMSSSNIKQAPHTLGKANKPKESHLCNSEPELASQFDNNSKRSIKKRMSKSFKELLDVPVHDGLSKDKEPILSPQHSRYSSPTWSPSQKTKSEQLCPLSINVESLSCSSYNSTFELQMLDSSSEILSNHVQEEGASTKETSSPKGYVVTIPQVDDPLKDSICATLISKKNTKKPVDVAEIREINRSSPCSTLDFSEEQPELGSPLLQRTPATVLIPNIETSHSPWKTERRCSVSVLESLLLEKIIRNDVFRLSPQKITFEDQDESVVNVKYLNSETGLELCVRNDKFKYEYMRALLIASGLYQSDDKKREHNLTPILDVSLYDEVETPSGEIPDDLKILFDCIAEVLKEIYESSADSMPWVSFIDPNYQPFPCGEKLIQEAWKGLNIHFVPWFPVTLEQVVKKDFDTRTWMDIRYGVEEFGIILGDEILDNILEETIHEL